MQLTGLASLFWLLAVFGTVFLSLRMAALLFGAALGGCGGSVRRRIHSLSIQDVVAARA